MLRSLRVGIWTLAIVVSVALVSASAQATPPPKHPTPNSSTVDNGHTVTLTKGQTEAVTLARKATLKGESGSRLDWKKVKKVFGKHTSLRDGYGAGVWSRRKDWKQFKNISKDDKKKIITWAKTRPGPNPTLRAMKPRPCTGETKLTRAPAWVSIMWYNSCDTNNIKALLDVCMPVAGLIGAIALTIFKDAKDGVPLAGLAVACIGARVWVGKAQEASDVNAVIWYMAPTSMHGGKLTDYVDIQPQ